MGDSVTCTWVYDAEEYKTTQVLARRLYTAWWRLAIFVAIILCGAAGSFSPNKSEVHDIGFWIPIGIIILLALYVVAQQLPLRAFCGTWNFRRGTLYNTHLTQTISPEGYFSDEDDARVLIKWSGLGRAVETSQGFALLRPGKKKTFFWLPKHGFSTPEDIDLCRAIIRENLSDFRTLES